MPRPYGHSYHDARILKTVANERRLRAQDRGGYGVRRILPVSCRTFIGRLNNDCNGATYNSGDDTWTLSSEEVTVQFREQGDDELLSQDIDNTISSYDLIPQNNFDDDVIVRVFNYSILPILRGPVVISQDIYGDLFFINAPQQIIVTPNANIAKSNSVPGTCTVDGSSLTVSAYPRGAAVTASKLCIAWASPDNKKIYVGPWECS